MPFQSGPVQQVSNDFHALQKTIIGFFATFTRRLKEKHLLPQKTTPQMVMGFIGALLLGVGLVSASVLAQLRQDIRQQAATEAYPDKCYSGANNCELVTTSDKCSAYSYWHTNQLACLASVCEKDGGTWNEIDLQCDMPVTGVTCYSSATEDCNTVTVNDPKGCAASSSYHSNFLDCKKFICSNQDNKIWDASSNSCQPREESSAEAEAAPPEKVKCYASTSKSCVWLMRDSCDGNTFHQNKADCCLAQGFDYVDGECQIATTEEDETAGVGGGGGRVICNASTGTCQELEPIDTGDSSSVGSSDESCLSKIECQKYGDSCFDPNNDGCYEVYVGCSAVGVSVRLYGKCCDGLIPGPDGDTCVSPASISCSADFAVACRRSGGTFDYDKCICRVEPSSGKECSSVFAETCLAKGGSFDGSTCTCTVGSSQHDCDANEIAVCKRAGLIYDYDNCQCQLAMEPVDVSGTGASSVEEVGAADEAQAPSCSQRLGYATAAAQQSLCAARNFLNFSSSKYVWDKNSCSCVKTDTSAVSLPATSCAVGSCVAGTSCSGDQVSLMTSCTVDGQSGVCCQDLSAVTHSVTLDKDTGTITSDFQGDGYVTVHMCYGELIAGRCIVGEGEYSQDGSAYAIGTVDLSLGIDITQIVSSIPCGSGQIDIDAPGSGFIDKNGISSQGGLGAISFDTGIACPDGFTFGDEVASAALIPEEEAADSGVVAYVQNLLSGIPEFFGFSSGTDQETVVDLDIIAINLIDPMSDEEWDFLDPDEAADLTEATEVNYQGQTYVCCSGEGESGSGWAHQGACPQGTSEVPMYGVSVGDLSCQYITFDEYIETAVTASSDLTLTGMTNSQMMTCCTLWVTGDRWGTQKVFRTTSQSCTNLGSVSGYESTLLYPATMCNPGYPVLLDQEGELSIQVSSQESDLVSPTELVSEEAATSEQSQDSAVSTEGEVLELHPVEQLEKILDIESGSSAGQQYLCCQSPDGSTQYVELFIGCSQVSGQESINFIRVDDKIYCGDNEVHF